MLHRAGRSRCLSLRPESLLMETCAMSVPAESNLIARPTTSSARSRASRTNSSTSSMHRASSRLRSFSRSAHGLLPACRSEAVRSSRSFVLGPRSASAPERRATMRSWPARWEVRTDALAATAESPFVLIGGDGRIRVGPVPGRMYRYKTGRHYVAAVHVGTCRSVLRTVGDRSR